MTEVPTRHRFTVDEWQEMGSLASFGADARIELLDGEIVDMAPIGKRHAFTVGWLVRHFVSVLGDRAVLWPQNPIRLDDHSEVQPDLALLEPPIERYREHYARPKDVLLLVEVADTSLAYDKRKSKRYAAAGIPECWVADVNAEVVHVLAVPTPGGYQSQRTVRRGDTIRVTLLDLDVLVEDVLGADR